jgi:hypothetical protein
MKGKGKSKLAATPAPLLKKKSSVPSEHDESEHAGSQGEGSEDKEGDDGSGVVTRKMKVKRGKRLVNMEVMGPRNTYNSLGWHQVNDLFVFDIPNTSTGSNKIVTHAYPYDEKHPHFSRTWKHQTTLASLLVHSFFTRGKVCPRCPPSLFTFPVAEFLLFRGAFGACSATMTALSALWKRAAHRHMQPLCQDEP